MADFLISPPGPGAALQVDASPGYSPTPDESAWLAQVNAYAARLAALGADGAAPDAPHVANERDQAIQRLQASAEKVVNTSPPARDGAAHEAVLDAFWDEGVLTERLAPAPAGQQRFEVTLLQDRSSGLAIDLDIKVPDGPISEGKQQFRVQLDQVVTVVKAVLSNADDDLPAQPQPGAAWYVRLWTAWRRLDPVDPVGWTSARLDKYLRDLLGIAQIGLVRTDPTQAQFASLSLTGFKAEFVTREAGRIKNRYVRRLGLRALVAVAVASALFIATKLLVPDPWILSRFRNFFLLADGAAVGTWLSFSIRRQILSFADLDTLEEDRLNPALRILFMIGLTTVVGLILWTGMVVVEVGRFRSDFTLTGSYAVLIGALCGIAERSLSGAVGQRATQFAASIGGNPNTAA